MVTTKLTILRGINAWSSPTIRRTVSWGRCASGDGTQRV